MQSDSKSIWIIDDEPTIANVLSRSLRRLGYDTQLFSDAESAIRESDRITNQSSTELNSTPDVLVVDMRLPGMDGIHAIEALRKRFSKAQPILITAFGDLSTAVKAIESKVFEYMVKPFDLDHAISVIERVYKSQLPISPPPSPQLDTTSDEGLPISPLDTTTAASNRSIHAPELLGTSRAMQEIYKRIAFAAASDCVVLVTGESGTGKELVSRAIHNHGARNEYPYLALAPVSLNPTLIESELFGHERGAFTGAERTRPGLFDLAADGTVLLDEIGDLPLELQAKLLRVLEQREYYSVGGTKPKQLGARIIAATHRNLVERVASGEFREDLYFRLAVFNIHLPPLRERPEDILTIANHFLARNGYPPNNNWFSTEAKEFLLSHSWPGNVRELRNTIDHAAIVARGNPIFTEHFPQKHHSPSLVPSGLHIEPSKTSEIPNQKSRDLEQQISNSITAWLDQRYPTDAVLEPLQNPTNPAQESPYEEFLRVVETPLLATLIERFGGNRAAVAGFLNLHRSTLRQKLRKYNFQAPPANS